MSLVQRCLTCPTDAPACPACASNEQCQIIGQSCTQCSYSICVPISSPTNGDSGGGGVSTGALVGAIVAAIAVLVLAVLAYFYYRRRAVAKRARDVRKSTSTGEKSTRSGRTANNRSPVVPTSDARNPFSDVHTAEEGVSYITPNANPGPPGTGDEAMPDHPYALARPISNVPPRPPRAPELDLKAPQPTTAQVDTSPKKDKRQSALTTGSSIASDSESAVIYDARTQSAVRHVFGAPAKALVVPLNASSASLPLQRSPLGQASYSADQVEDGAADAPAGQDPFADRPVSRNSMSTVVTYDPDNVQIMNATLAPPRQSASSSGSGHVVAKGPIAARANLLPIRVPPQGMPSLVAYQTAIGQAAARPPPSPHDSLPSPGHARHISSATTATTASGFSTSSSLLSSFPFVPPSPLGMPRQRSPESMTFSVRDGDEGLQAIHVERATPLPPQSRPTSAWSNVSGASSAPPHPALPGSIPPVPAIPAGLPKRVVSSASTMTTGSILSAFPFHIPASAHSSGMPLSALPSSIAIPDHDDMCDSIPPEAMRSQRASLDSAILSKQVGELGNLD